MAGQPAPGISMDHPQPWLRRIQPCGHRLQIGAGHHSHSPVALDCQHLRGPSLQGLTSHHAAAAAQIQPSATGQFGRQQIEHRLAHPRRRGSSRCPGGTLQPAATAETQGHG